MEERLAELRYTADWLQERGIQEASDSVRRCADDLAAALAESGWRGMDDCPSDDGAQVWIWYPGLGKPRVARAWGAHWRRLLAEEQPPAHTPTMWRPCEVPPPPEDAP